MSFVKYAMSIIMLIILLFLVSIVIGKNSLYTNQDTVVRFYRVPDTMDISKESLDMMKAIEDASSNPKFVKTAFRSAQLILFETLNNVDNIISTLTYPHDVKWIFGVAGSDKIASKSMLAYILSNALSSSIANEIIPVTYIVGHVGDLNRLKAENKKGDVYILKKNIQQQKGMLILDDINKVLSVQSEFVVIQKMLQNPYIVKGRKCNMRVYFLIVVRPSSNVEMYYYDDGFMYYTEDDFKMNSTNTKEVITTGLAGRDMYKTRPLTHLDFGVFLGTTMYAKLKHNLHRLCSYFKAAYTPILIEENRLLPGTKFSIFGMDIAPDNTLGCKLLEVNKGPDLTPKDSRDAELKQKMVADALSIVNIKRVSKCGFIRV